MNKHGFKAHRYLPLLATALSLAACATTQPYQAPTINAGASWALATADASAPHNLARWWTTLKDPVLERLVETALRQNLDLQQAAARIEEARAWRDRAAGRQLPAAAAGASINHRRQSRNGPLPVGRIPGLEVTQTIFDAGFDASWEADIFGGQKSALQSAAARLQATEIEAQGVRMRVAAEVARAWFSASGAAAEQQAQRAAIATLEQTFLLMQERASLGDVAVAEVDAAAAQLATAKAALPAIEARQRTAILSLGTLLGQLPEQELALLSAPPSPLILPDLPVGERADILRRRPDVLAAERQLAASTSDIGTATAELFPKLAINIGGGFQALDAGNWFSADSSRFSILPFISWRLFDGGRVRAEIRASKARSQQAALAYEQAVLASLEDAERSLGNYQAGLNALNQQQEMLNATRRSVAHAQARMSVGEASRMGLLSAEYQLHSAELARAQARTAAAIQLVALYKALGGGWNIDAISSNTANGTG